MSLGFNKSVFTSGHNAAVTNPLPRANGVLQSTVYAKEFNTIGGSLHQRREFLPIGGQWVRVRLIYEAPQNVAAWEVNAHAVAAGRAYNEIDPKNVDGTPATFQVGAAFTTAAGPAGLYDITESYSPWYTVYVPPDVNFPRWGTLVIRSRNTVANAGRGRTFTALNGKGNVIGLTSPYYKNTYEYAPAGTDIVTQNLAGVLSSSADVSDPIRNLNAFQLEIQLTQPVFQVSYFADSRGQGVGTASGLYSFLLRSVEELQAEGRNIGYEFGGLAGVSHSVFHAYAMDRLNKPNRKLPDVLGIQIGSTNNLAWTMDSITQDMNRNLELIAKCRSLGVRPFFCLMYPSTGATTQSQADAWRAEQIAGLTSGIPCIDFYNDQFFTTGGSIPALPTTLGFNADAAHLNDPGHSVAASRLGIPFLRSLMNI